MLLIITAISLHEKPGYLLEGLMLVSQYNDVCATRETEHSISSSTLSNNNVHIMD